MPTDIVFSYRKEFALDLLTLFRIVVTGVAFAAPSTSPLTQRTEQCHDIQGMIDSNGADASLNRHIDGCVAMIADAVVRCATDGNYLHLTNTRSVPIAWRSKAANIQNATLEPGRDVLAYLPYARGGTDTPPVDVEVAFCE